jgi:hypothetical protein
MEGALAELPAIPADDFRAAMRGLASAVCVITSRHETLANGMTATAVCSVSADPPSILVVVNRSNRSQALIRDSGVFAVHVLAKGQERLATHFASRPEDPFVDVPVRPGATAAPMIENCETGSNASLPRRLISARILSWSGVSSPRDTASPSLFCIVTANSDRWRDRIRVEGVLSSKS